METILLGTLSGASHFVANAAHPAIPLAQMPADFRVHGLILDFNCLAESGTVATFEIDNEAARNGILDSLLSAITVDSPALGTIVDGLSLVELWRLTKATAGRESFCLANLPRFADITLGTAGDYTLRGQLVIPFDLPTRSALKLLTAPQAAFLQNGMVRLTNGDLSFADNATTPNTWTFTAASCTIEVKAYGRRPADRRVAKASPIRYKRMTSSSRERNDFASGIYVHMQLENYVPDDESGTNGIEIKIDGNVYQTEGGYDPRVEGALHEWKHGLRGIGDVLDFSGAQGAEARENQAEMRGIVVLDADPSDPLGGYPVAHKDLHIRLQSDYANATHVFLWSVIEPRSNINDVQGCPCEREVAIRAVKVAPGADPSIIPAGLSKFLPLA